MRIISIIFALLMMVSCSTKGGYTIKGVISEPTNGEVFLIHNNDTISRDVIKNGKFKLTGNLLSEVAEVKLETADGEFSRVIFLENCDFNVTDSTITGGANQNIANSYLTIERDFNALSQKWYDEYYPDLCKALETGDTLTSNDLYAKYDVIEKKMKDERLKFIQDNDSSYVAICLVKRKIIEDDFEDILAEYNLLADKYRDSDVGKELSEYIKQHQGFVIGDVVPNFTLSTPDGGEISLYDITSKVKIVDFWASWCGPCRAENPNLLKIYKEFSPKGLEILGVALEAETDKEAWLKAIKKDGLVWKHGSDFKKWKSDLVSIFSLQGIPFSLVLNENNEIIGKDLHGKELRELLIEHLK